MPPLNTSSSLSSGTFHCTQGDLLSTDSNSSSARALPSSLKISSSFRLGVSSPSACRASIHSQTISICAGVRVIVVWVLVNDLANRSQTVQTCVCGVSLHIKAIFYLGFLTFTQILQNFSYISATINRNWKLSIKLGAVPVHFCQS